MTKFVYVSNDYRQAWSTYVVNVDDMWQPEVNIDELEFLLAEEQHYLHEYTRPSTWYLNDLLGENKFVFNMSTFDFPKIEFEYTDGLPSFDDIMMNRAIEMRDMGKEIEILYSGGIDSVAIMYALVEVCPRDQLRIIMGDETPVEIYPGETRGDYVVVCSNPHNFKNNETISISGLSTTSSVGSLSIRLDPIVSLEGLSATSSVALFGTSSGFGIQAYQSVDTGSNSSYTNVATGSNTSYSDAA